MANTWAPWLHNPCRPRGVPYASKRGTKSELDHKWAQWLHNPCHWGGSPMLQNGGQNQKWPTIGPDGYITLVVRRGRLWVKAGDSEVAHKGAQWRHNPCRLGGTPMVQNGGQNQKWTTSGPNGYITPAILGGSLCCRAGDKIRSAHKWAQWLHDPCRPGGRLWLKAGDKTKSGPQVGPIVT